MEVEYYKVRDMHFDNKMAEKMSLKKWMELFGNHPYLLKDDVEDIFYKCGGKMPKKKVEKLSKED